MNKAVFLPFAKWHANGLLAFRLARRELRAGFRDFRIFLICLSLAVAAIASIGSLSAALIAGLNAEGRAILGGDVSLRFRNQPAPPAVRAWLAENYAFSHVTTLRGMAQRATPAGLAALPNQTGAPKRALLVEIKTVDNAYPLAGTLQLTPAVPLQQILERKQDHYGIIVDPHLLEQLGLKLGAQLQLGAGLFDIRATSAFEPDRLATGFALGPQVILSHAGLQASGLDQPGGLITHHYRLRLPPPASDTQIENIRALLKTEFADMGGRIRDRNDASPPLRRNIERISIFLTLIALMTFVVGGVGMGNAVRAWLDSRRNVIASLKCLGATGKLIYCVYLLQIIGLALFGIFIGLAVGICTPFVAQFILANYLPFTLQTGLYPSVLIAAAGFGLLTAFVFALAPLARAYCLPPALLWRAHISPARTSLRPILPFSIFAYAVSAIGLAAISGLIVQRLDILLWFIIGLAANCLLLCGGALALKQCAAWARRRFTIGSPILRLALANISRPDAPIVSVMLSMGLAVTLLAAIALTAANITQQINKELPQDAPNFFMIDIQPHQFAPLRALIKNHTGVEQVKAVPLLRGRITHIKNIAAEKFDPPEDIAWVLRGDRGLTYASVLPADSELTAGTWWAADYQGAPLVSLEEEVAHGLGLTIGDSITVNVLGRSLTAQIASLRKVNWRDVQINFAMVFSPQPLAAAPHGYFMSVQMQPAQEALLQNIILARYPNISIIRVQEMIALVNNMLRDVNFAVQSMGFLSICAGIFVLAGAIASGQRTRLYDGVVMKVLGATRAHIVATYLLEYALLGLGMACVAALFGALTAWAFVTQIMDLNWFARPDILVAMILGTSLTVILLALFGTWRALGHKSVPILRNH